MKARISLNERGESIQTIANTLGWGVEKIDREVREMNKKSLGGMVANSCVQMVTKNQNPN